MGFPFPVLIGQFLMFFAVQVVVGMRRLEHPCLARMQSVFFSDSHAYLHLQVPERIVTMDAWLKQQVSFLI